MTVSLNQVITCYILILIKKPLKVNGEWLNSFTLHKFEDAEFFIPVEYDGVLTAIYGDYMTPPPPEKQVTHHSNKMYWKN